MLQDPLRLLTTIIRMEAILLSILSAAAFLLFPVKAVRCDRSLIKLHASAVLRVRWWELDSFKVLKAEHNCLEAIRIQHEHPFVFEVRLVAARCCFLLPNVVLELAKMLGQVVLVLRIILEFASDAAILVRKKDLHILTAFLLVSSNQDLLGVKVVLTTLIFPVAFPLNGKALLVIS